MSLKYTKLPTPSQSDKFNTILEISRRLMSLKQETRRGAILEQLQAIIDYHSAVLLLFGPENLVEHKFTGSIEQTQALKETGLLSQLSVLAITWHKPFIVDDIWADSPPAQKFRQAVRNSTPDASRWLAVKQAFKDSRAFLGIPLIVEQKTTGLIGLFHRQPGYYQADHATFGLAFGDQVAVALANEQLYQRAQNLAILEERDRLARELHDNLAQTLGYLNLRLAESSQLLYANELSSVQAILRELRHLVNETYTDVREEIFNLRASKSINQGFLDSLREYTAKYKLHYKLDISLIIPVDESSLQFAPEVSSQLMRIIQEALINVRKHTTENRATVRLHAANGQTRVSIEDSGSGFNPAEVSLTGRGGLGLQIMRERAESIGGSLKVESKRSTGTKVIVTIPAIIEVKD